VQNVAWPDEFGLSKTSLLLVLFTHALLLWFLLQHNLPEAKKSLSKPMMVSLIAPSAPAPELAPMIEPPKPIVEPKPKKVVEKIKPIETPAERFVEAPAEPPQEQEINALQAAPVLESRPVPAEQKVEPMVEDIVEPPRFGVSYLNNPAPDYPAMSRRAGEEGRVVMKVLVSAEGLAEDVQIEKSSGSERLDNAAMDAVKKWRFIPAKKNNQPLSAYVLVPMKFSLDS
jgi:periplasmic protein TonB